MKFSKMSQLFLVSSVGLTVAALLSCLSACDGRSRLWPSSAGSSGSPNGQIDYLPSADSPVGALRKGAATISSGGVDPVAMTVTSTYTDLYVANAGSNSIVHFAVATNGVLTQKDAVTLAGQPARLRFPAVGRSHQPLRRLRQHDGYPHRILSVFGSYRFSCRTQVHSADSRIHVGRSGSHRRERAGQHQFSARRGSVRDRLRSIRLQPGRNDHQHRSSRLGLQLRHRLWRRSHPGLGQSLSGRRQAHRHHVQTRPDRFVYVTDFASNQVIGYGIQDGSTLAFLINGPFKTGNEPQAVTIDPRGKFMYIANSLDSSVSAFLIDLGTGTPSAAVNPTGSAVNATDTQPMAIAVDPALGRFVYTANFLGNSVSGFRLDPNAGNLTATQATPYPSDAKPTALAIVPHGNHSVQNITP